MGLGALELCIHIGRVLHTCFVWGEELFETVYSNHSLFLQTVSHVGNSTVTVHFNSFMTYFLPGEFPLS